MWYIDISGLCWITRLLGMLALAVAGDVNTGQTWVGIVGAVAAGLAVMEVSLSYRDIRYGRYPLLLCRCRLSGN
jgi:hypothetical protein